MSYFNIRVYGLLVNEKNELLISDEREYGQEFTKFPGGGVELGEGIRNGLIREYVEECGIDIEVGPHIHTTDDYIPSAFNDSQVIAVYYQVVASEDKLAKIVVSDRQFDFQRHDREPEQSFRWIPIQQMREQDLTFDMDRTAWRIFSSQFIGPSCGSS